MTSQVRESAAEFELRFKTQMRRAFFDVIRSTMEDESKKEKAHEWLVELHQELHDRLCALMPSRKDKYDEFIDTELFARMLRGGAFQTDQLASLINYVFEQLKEGAAPDMDSDIDRRQAAVMACFKPDASFGSIVSPFLDHSHLIIDEIVKRVMHLSATQQSS